MRIITVNKAQLIAILEKNMAEHREVFLEAQKKYREVVIAALDAELKAAREGRPFELRRLVQLTAPEDHTADYQRNIEMLKMSVDEHIDITEQEFASFLSPAQADNLRKDWEAVKTQSRLVRRTLAQCIEQDGDLDDSYGF
jgi:hypothetical protein